MIEVHRGWKKKTPTHTHENEVLNNSPPAHNLGSEALIKGSPAHNYEKEHAAVWEVIRLLIDQTGCGLTAAWEGTRADA